MSGDVLTFVENGVGRIRLNRPKALHALTLPMCEAIVATLLAWADDDAVVAVMIDHAEGRGFCAGGDIAMIAASAKTDCVEAEAFFHAEYRMNHLLFVYAKPIVAFIDGIVMGGGVGLSMPARFRVATDRTIFAMPETGIGLFPDVGGGWFLPRLPGRVGAWLAATGARIDGADCVAAGIATQYLPSERLDAVKARILADPLGIGDILDENAVPPPASKLADHRDDIDRLFASDRAEEIVAALDADAGPWARQQLETLAAKSPQTVKVSLRQLALGAGLTSFADDMAMEYDLARAVIRRPDFVEGVRAVIMDKDNSPKWQPATLEAVSDAMLDALFAPRPDRWTPLPELSGAG